MAPTSNSPAARVWAVSRDGLPGTGALIKVGYRCDQQCVFCHASAHRRYDAPAERVHALVDRAHALGHRRVVFSGGEPTLRAELGAWARHARRLGMGFGLVTNGQRLADRSLAQALLGEGLEYVHLSLHGPREVHARAVGVDSYDAVRRAIDHLAGRLPRLVVNCVVTSLNLERLGALARELSSLSGVVLKLSLVEPKGEALLRFADLVPPVDEAAAAIARAMDERAADGRTALRLAHDGVPLCLLGRHAEHRSDLRTEGLTMMAEAQEHDLHPVDDQNRIHPPICRGCAVRGRCPGIYRATLEAHGDGALGPAFAGPLGNSFHYVLQRWRDAEEDGCPVAAIGTAPWDRGRDLWVRHGSRAAHYHSNTRDFTDREIEAVKLGTEQLYFDAAASEAPSDFRHELVPLRRAACCASCEQEPVCTGLYEPCFRDLFAPFDARVRELLSSLTGELLDIGCGDGRHCSSIAPAVLAGRARYLGIDPVADAVARLRVRYPWADARVMPEEALDPAEAFDHILLLGSWNHLPDPAAAAARIVRRLRAGGTLTVSDDVPFGLARSRARAASAERAATAREHLRLDGLSDARALLEPLGLELLAAIDVSPATATRWLLQLRKAPHTLPL